MFSFSSKVKVSLLLLAATEATTTTETTTAAATPGSPDCTAWWGVTTDAHPERLTGSFDGFAALAHCSCEVQCEAHQNACPGCCEVPSYPGYAGCVACMEQCRGPAPTPSPTQGSFGYGGYGGPGDGYGGYGGCCYRLLAAPAGGAGVYDVECGVDEADCDGTFTTAASNTTAGDGEGDVNARRGVVNGTCYVGGVPCDASREVPQYPNPGVCGHQLWESPTGADMVPSDVPCTDWEAGAHPREDPHFCVERKMCCETTYCRVRCVSGINCRAIDESWGTTILIVVVSAAVLLTAVFVAVCIVACRRAPPPQREGKFRRLEAGERQHVEWPEARGS